MVAIATAQEIKFNARCDLRSAVNELQRRMQSRVDFVADARQMDIRVSDGKVYLLAKAGTPMSEFIDSTGAELTPNAVSQFLEKEDVPVPAVFGGKLIQSHPDVAESLLRELLHRGKERRMVRMLDGRVRAFLSDRYKTLDNYDLAYQALKVAKTVGAEVLECHLTDDVFRLKMIDRKLWGDLVAAKDENKKAGELSSHRWIGRNFVNPGEDLPGGAGTVWPMIGLSNSETGRGGCHVNIGICHAICLNGAVIDKAMRAIHLGAELPSGILSKEAIDANARTVYLQVRDILTAAFNHDQFHAMIDRLNGNASRPIAAPAMAVDVCISEGWIPAEVRDAVFSHFIADYRHTVGGLSGAISRTSQDIDDADKAEEMMEVAGNVLANPSALFRGMQALQTA